MMRRLVDQADARQPTVARAAKLLAAAPSSAPSDAMRRRVLASVVRDHPPFAARRLLARPLFFVAVLSATTVAAASFQRGWLPRSYEAAAAWSGALAFWRPAERPRTASAIEPSLSATRELDLPREDLPLVSSLAQAAFEVASERSPVGPARRRVSRDATKLRAAPAVASEPSSAQAEEGAAVVLAAVQSLRRDHDGARAGAFIEQYLREHPQGVLREEAMALAVEAASSRGDRAGSEALVLRYQRAFPTGRFAHSLRRVP